MEFLNVSINGIDIKKELERIKKNIDVLFLATEQLADFTEDIRNALTEKYIDFSAYRLSVNAARKTLLIDCYTLSEQLYKEFYYEIIGFNEDEDSMRQVFLNLKIPRDKFSPNISFESIIKELTSFNKNFSFFLNKNNEGIEAYTEMVADRHKYAHANNYNERTKEDYYTILYTIEYLAFEFYRFSHKSNIHESLRNYDKIVKELKSLENIHHLKAKYPELVKRIREVEDLREFKLPFLLREKFRVDFFLPVLSKLTKIEKFELKEELFLEIKSRIQN